MRIWGVEEDRREFAEFYAAARDDCLRVVLISVGDRQLAEDLVAEAFTRAWTGELSFRKSNDLLLEYACHEGNYTMTNILAGARAEGTR